MERNKQLLRYLSLLIEELLEHKDLSAEKQEILSALGLSHDEAKQEAAEIIAADL